MVVTSCTLIQCAVEEIAGSKRALVITSFQVNKLRGHLKRNIKVIFKFQWLISVLSIMLNVYCLGMMAASKKMQRIEFFLIGYQGVMDLLVTGIIGFFHNIVLFIQSSKRLCSGRDFFKLVARKT